MIISSGRYKHLKVLHEIIFGRDFKLSNTWDIREHGFDKGFVYR